MLGVLSLFLKGSLHSSVILSNRIVSRCACCKESTDATGYNSSKSCVLQFFFFVATGCRRLVSQQVPGLRFRERQMRELWPSVHRTSVYSRSLPKSLCSFKSCPRAGQKCGRIVKLLPGERFQGQMFAAVDIWMWQHPSCTSNAEDCHLYGGIGQFGR